MSYYYNGFENNNWGRFYEGRERFLDSSIERPTISKSGNIKVYNEYLQNAFYSYLVSNASWYLKFSGGRPEINQFEINNGVNETFIKYLERIEKSQGNFRCLNLAQMKGDFFVNNVLNSNMVNKEEFKGDCKTISTVYEALLTSHGLMSYFGSREAYNSGEMFQSGPSRVFYDGDFFRGDENSGRKSYREVKELIDEDACQVLGAIEIIAGVSEKFENAFQNDFEGFFLRGDETMEIMRQNFLNEANQGGMFEPYCN